jgi:hypothetical protein
MVSPGVPEYVIGLSPDRPISITWELSHSNSAWNVISHFATAEDANKWLHDVQNYGSTLISAAKLWKALNKMEQQSSFQRSSRYADMRCQVPILCRNLRTLVQSLGANLQIFRTYMVHYGLIGQGVNYVPPALIVLMTIMEDNLGLT